MPDRAALEERAFKVMRNDFPQFTDEFLRWFLSHMKMERLAVIAGDELSSDCSPSEVSPSGSG